MTSPIYTPSIYPLVQRMAQKRWVNWQLDRVSIDNDEAYVRKNIIKSFIEDDLIPFIQRNGYTFACEPFRISECIARVLYFGRLSHEPLNTEYIDDDYDHYYYTIDDEKWEYFWKNWSWWKDLGDEYKNYHEEIRYCVWTLLDIGNSKQTRILNEILGINNDDDTSSRASDNDKRYKGIDPYLNDLAKGYIN